MIRKVLSLSLLMASVHGVPMDPLKVVHLNISNTGHTRISVDGDGIQDVFARPTSMKNHFELNKLGHLLVVGEGLNETAFITIFTKKGLVQDLILKSIPKDPEPIVFEKNQKTKVENNFEDGFVRILSSFAAGNPPVEFHKNGAVSYLRTHQALESRLQESWYSNEYRIFVFEVENVSEDSIELKEPALALKEDLALWIQTRHLEKGQKTRIITIQERQGKNEY